MNDRITDVSGFAQGGTVFHGPVHLIVKSQDQVERRARLVDSLRQGKIGRMEHRDIATGLWVQCTLYDDCLVNRSNSRTFEFKEPRGLAFIEKGKFLLSDVNRVLLLDSNATVLRVYEHPFFAFLHSVSFDQNSQRFLVVSSGYDCLIEMDLYGNVCWEWFAWEHGFNPTLEGVYLCRTREQAKILGSDGKETIFVDPMKYKAYGLMTSQRSNHPNSGCYHPSDTNLVLATLGHSGEVVEIDKRTGSWRSVVSGLKTMPHGIQPHEDGWMVTNTLMGEFWILDKNFELIDKILTRNLPGKPEELGENEWLQAVYPLNGGCYIGLDANRGLIFIDTKSRRYRVFSVDDSWCVHHWVGQS